MSQVLRSLWVAIAIFGSTAGAFAADTGASLVGIWMTQNGRAKVEIKECKPGMFCGALVQLHEPIDPETKAPKLDKKNPDASLQKRPILGLMNLHGFRAGGENYWDGGKIYNPRNGKTYSCEITLEDSDTLTVRGYVGISMFGKSQTWKRTTLAAPFSAIQDDPEE